MDLGLGLAVGKGEFEAGWWQQQNKGLREDEGILAVVNGWLLEWNWLYHLRAYLWYLGGVDCERWEGSLNKDKWKK